VRIDEVGLRGDEAPRQRGGFIDTQQAHRFKRVMDRMIAKRLGLLPTA